MIVNLNQEDQRFVTDYVKDMNKYARIIRKGNDFVFIIV